MTRFQLDTVRTQLAVVLLLVGLIILAVAISVIDIGNESPISPISPVPIIYIPSAVDFDYFVYLPVITSPLYIPNLDFEEPFGGDCIWWQCDEIENGECVDITVFTGCKENQFVPKHWTMGYRNRYPGIEPYQYTGQPEARPAERWIDKRRVLSGNYAIHAFTFFRIADFWFYQKATMHNKTIVFRMYGQVWHADNLAVRVCIDRSGGNTPYEGDLVCSAWKSPVDKYQLLETPPVKVSGEITLMLQVLSLYATENNDGYFDAGEVVEVD